jgi:hypothetical protein
MWRLKILAHYAKVKRVQGGKSSSFTKELQLDRKNGGFYNRQNSCVYIALGCRKLRIR